jgi:hypothetical protein
MGKHAAKVYPLNGPTVLVKQLVKGSKNVYVTDLDGKRHRERHVRLDDDKALADAIRAAMAGRLTGDERIV